MTDPELWVEQTRQAQGRRGEVGREVETEPAARTKSRESGDDGRSPRADSNKWMVGEAVVVGGGWTLPVPCAGNK